MDPNHVLLDILVDPRFPPQWARFDGLTYALAEWFVEEGGHEQAEQAVQTMLAKGLNPMVPIDDDEQPFLHLAVRQEHEPVLKRLVQHMVDHGQAEQLSAHAGKAEVTAAWIACAGRKPSILAHLLTAMRSAKEIHCDHSLLWRVCVQRESDVNVAMLEMLLRTDAADLIDFFGHVVQDHQRIPDTTALHQAVAYDHVRHVGLLLDAGARLDLPNRLGVTAWDLALTKQNASIIDLMASHRVARERVLLATTLEHRSIQGLPKKRPRL